MRDGLVNFGNAAVSQALRYTDERKVLALKLNASYCSIRGQMSISAMIWAPAPRYSTSTHSANHRHSLVPSAGMRMGPSRYCACGTPLDCKTKYCSRCARWMCPYYFLSYGKEYKCCRHCRALRTRWMKQHRSELRRQLDQENEARESSGEQYSENGRGNYYEYYCSPGRASEKHGEDARSPSTTSGIRRENVHSPLRSSGNHYEDARSPSRSPENDGEDAHLPSIEPDSRMSIETLLNHE